MIELNRVEAELLCMVIDHWVDGLPAAEDATIQDRSIETIAELLDLIADYALQTQVLGDLRARICVEVLSGDAT